MSSLTAFEGRFTGSGRWHDSASNSQGYRIQQTNRLVDSGFEMQFRHDFDDGSVVEAHFIMRRIAPHLFQVQVSGATVGDGYWLADTWHYHLEVGGRFVEASYRLTPTGLQVLGSSSKNNDGNYIAWQEELKRVDQTP
jgi:hypothetical protein